MYSGISFDSALFVQHRAEHPNTEVEDGEGQCNADAEADTPDGVQVVLAGGRDHDEEDGNGERAAELQECE